MTAAEHAGIATARAELDIAVALDHRHHHLDMRQPTQGVGVGDGQRFYAAEQAAQATGAGHAGADRDVARAELREILQHIAAQPLADRGEQCHRGDADGHTEQRQQAAQRPTEQRRSGQF
ncbi:hypothetical protein FQZ97_1117760 [compost metagenome]